MAIGIPSIAVAQDTSLARVHLQYLSSKVCKGRGYTKNGHVHAARYVRESYIKSGLKPLQGSYLQPLRIEQNLFRKTPSLCFNGRKAQPAIDFLPSPACRPVKGRFTIRVADSAFLETRKGKPANTNSGEAWIITPYLARQRNFKTQWKPGCWLRLVPKLTHSLAEQQEETPEMVVKETSIASNDTVLTVNIHASQEHIETANVVGFVPGRTVPDSFLVVCAHYDHLGMLGPDIFFPGANDNASGVSTLLEMASLVAKQPLRYSVVFIAFTGEEAGLLGSRYFVANPLVPLSSIRFVLNLDLLGFGDLGATVVNATVHPALFDRLVQINHEKQYLKELKPRGKASNSDHYPFSEAGVPAFFLYTLGGPGYYHDVQDTAATVTFSRFSETFQLLMDFLKSF